MLTKKLLGAALACGMALGAWSGMALATPVNIGGVVVNPDSPLDLNIQALNFRETSVKNVGDELMGYGEIGSVNGTDAATFCPDCDLTFTFQYKLANVNDSNTNPQLVFDDGKVNLYVSPKNSFNVLDPSTAGTGPLWLSMSGHTAAHTGFNFLGQLYATISGHPGHPDNGSTGFGLLDVTGGEASWLADTNGAGDGADFSLDSSFQFQPVAAISQYPISGEGQMIGSSAVAVPEPGEIGLLGLGLGFLGLLIWRRRRESEGRR